MAELDRSDDLQMRGKSLLKVADLTKREFLSLIDLAERLRTEKRSGSERQRLVGRKDVYKRQAQDAPSRDLRRVPLQDVEV